MPLTPPSGVTVGTITCKAITISWTNNNVPTGRTANIPQRYITGVWTDATILASTSTSYIFNNLTPGATHEVRVCARDAALVKYCSTSVTGTTLYMSNPTNFSVNYGDCLGTKADLAWTNASSNGTSLRVIVMTGVSTVVQTNVMPTMSTTAYTVTGLTQGITYKFRVDVACGIYGYNTNTISKTMYSAVNATATPTNATCYGGTGQIVFSARSGGQGTWQQSIDGGGTWSATTTFSGLIASTYDCRIRDAACTANTKTIGNIVVTEPTQLYAQVNVAPSNCFGSNNGSISLVSRQGGSGVWQQSINSGSTWQNGVTFSGLAPGTYDVWMRDANAISCYITFDDNIITEPDLLYATAVGTNASYASSDGIITFSSMSGGSGFYEYSSDSGTTFTSNPITALAPGTYECWIRDLVTPLCKIFVGNIVVGEDLPTPFCSGTHYTITPSTCGNSTGSINVGGFSLTYDFELRDINGNVVALTGLSSGYYFLTATVKPSYQYLFPDDTCYLEWLQVNDSDTSLIYGGVSIKTIQCQPFDVQRGRIFYVISGLTSGNTYSFKAYLSDYSLYLSITGLTSSEDFIINPSPAQCYWVVIRDEVTGCAILIPNKCVQALTPLSLGGVKKLWIARWSDDLEYNYWDSADDDYFLEFLDTSFFTSTKIKEFLSLSGGTIQWYILPIAPQIVKLEQKLSKVRQGYVFTDNVTVAISDATAAKWTKLKTILNPEYKWIYACIDDNNNAWCGGYRHGARISTYSFASGNRGEDDGYSLEISSQSENKILTCLDYQYIKDYIM